MKKPPRQPEETRNQEKEEYNTVLTPREAHARLAGSYPKIAKTAELTYDGHLYWVAKFKRPTGMRIVVFVPDSKIDKRVISIFRSSFSLDIAQRRIGGYDMWIWVCDDCNVFHLFGEAPKNRDREIEVLAGEIIFGNIQPHYSILEGTIEHTERPCDVCEDKTPGARYRFHPAINPEE